MSQANDALVALTKIHSVQQENSKKLASIKQQFDTAKAAVFEYMTTNNLKFVSTGNNEYLVIEEKTSKPSLNAELLTVCYQLHCRDNLKKQCTEEEVKAFLIMTETVQSRLATKKQDLVFSKSKPMSALLE
jgi:hypothetical protein